ncbi:DUF397 domain-containing protein [Actinomadura madurae]|uniref:DUF397 domain-containing protein n=1 Tax=Actinomadura madurae TaxID=1993 RepID=A0A1I5T531_9ACTN|nr:DUF397 domain-containing protein [Actinomadura madurae]SFP77951.1 protein of unknown function [Actinomadura madurae]SPT59725.1 Domain of uncharacterised function (DUF397) [Actinomadura madurae]
MSFRGTPPARWRKSTRCGASNGCVEVARLDADAISVRDTEDAVTILAFGAGEWRRFTDEVKRGRFDRP